MLQTRVSKTLRRPRLWSDRDATDREEERGPGVLDILTLLPLTNCCRCGEASCMIFAVRLATGDRAPQQCPALDEIAAAELRAYLACFPRTIARE